MESFTTARGYNLNRERSHLYTVTYLSMPETGLSTYPQSVYLTSLLPHPCSVLPLL